MVEWIALVLAGARVSWNAYTWLRSRRTVVEVDFGPILGLDSLIGMVANLTVIDHTSASSLIDGLSDRQKRQASATRSH